MSYQPQDNRLRSKSCMEIGASLDSYINGQPSEDRFRGLKLKLAWENAATEQQLKHTDSVIFSKTENDGARVIVVYVDDSASAAAMTMQRELLRLLMEKELEYPIKEIRFKITRDRKWKQHYCKDHSFADDADVTASYIESGPSVELTADEDRYARELVSLISDEQLKLSLYKALKTDLEWKKSIRAQKVAQNGD